MEQIGVVKSINGDIAKIAFIKKSGCGGGCSSCKSGCPQDTVILEVQNMENAKVGDEVVVSITNSELSKLNFWAYVFPTFITILILAVSLAIFNYFSIANYELYASGFALIAMILSFKIGGVVSKKNSKDGMQLKMIKLSPYYKKLS